MPRERNLFISGEVKTKFQHSRSRTETFKVDHSRPECVTVFVRRPVKEKNIFCSEKAQNIFQTQVSLTPSMCVQGNQDFRELALILASSQLCLVLRSSLESFRFRLWSKKKMLPAEFSMFLTGWDGHVPALEGLTYTLSCKTVPNIRCLLWFCIFLFWHKQIKRSLIQGTK